MSCFNRVTRHRQIGLLVLGLACNGHSDVANRIILMPVDGRMMVNAVIPNLDRQVIGLGVPETIGSRERMWLVNHPDAHIVWNTDSSTGTVSTRWRQEGLIEYTLSLVPRTDRVDLAMTVRNLSAAMWHDVFAFNCISPARAPGLHDSSLVRTYASVAGAPTPLASLPRTRGRRPAVTVYPTRRGGAAGLPVFARAFEATAGVPTDESWVAVLDEAGETYLGTAAAEAAFLFTNTELGCIHAAPSFGDVAPDTEATVASRVYVGRGTLRDFLKRYDAHPPGG